MATMQVVWDYVKTIFDELTKNGVARPFEKNEDMQNKSYKFVDMCQKENFDLSSNFGTFARVITKHDNLLEDSYDYKEHMKTDIETPEFVAEAYYFEVDGTAEVILRENTGSGFIDTLISATSENGFTAYRGLIDTDNPVRLVFSGNTYYRYRNEALWNIPFEADRIPANGQFLKIELPDDFNGIADATEETKRTYYRVGDYRIEADKWLYIPSDYEGEIRFRYYKSPTTIVDLTTELSVKDIHVPLLAWYAAAGIAPAEQPNLTGYCEGKYQEALAKTDKPISQGFNKIKPHSLMRGLGV